jgi:NADPH:quinone reductase-like Zn-dependent oxidoreductase
VLVRVRAAGVNPVDVGIRLGYLDGLFDTYFPVIPGWDMAGVVERVGEGVDEFAPGDEVLGYVRKDAVQGGTYAELVAAPVHTLARKPPSMSWEQAAGLPLVGLTAYQTFTRSLHVGPGDTVLIHAAAGGVGSLGVQIARILGARVIGTASARNHDFLRELGAEPVEYGDGLIDRVRALAPEGVDAVADFIGGGVLVASVPLMKNPATKRLATIIDDEAAATVGTLLWWVRPDRADLSRLAAWADAGRLRVPVDRALPLAQAAEAHRLVAARHTRGKVVLTVS